VEGPLDLLAAQHWGVPGLAICGTGVSRAGLRLLTRWEHVYAALDADDAGQKGTARLVEALGERVISLALPEGRKDPAELAPLPQSDDLFRSAISQPLARRRRFSIGARPTRSAYPHAFC
jgi:DNA primase